MSGFLGILLASAAVTRRTVTIAASVAGANTIWGYWDIGSPTGSITDAAVGGAKTPPTALGTIELIGGVDSDINDYDFQISIDPTGAAYAQDAFTGVVVEDGTGVNRTYFTADATFSAGANSVWSWGTGSNRVWTSGDVGEQRSFHLF